MKIGKEISVSEITKPVFKAFILFIAGLMNLNPFILIKIFDFIIIILENQMKKTLILISILILYLITFSSSKTHKSEEDDDSRDDKPVTRSHSYSKSVFYSSSNINGKKRSRYSKSENEEHRTKKGNNPALVRKFNQKWDKRNDGPLVHQRKAYSNHPEERKYLRNRWKKRYYSRREEKVLCLFYSEIYEEFQ